jgi:hypothetical protein
VVLDDLKATRRLWALPAAVVVLGLGFSFRGVLLASSGGSVTVHGCVRETGRGTISDVSVNAHSSCPAGSLEIQWEGTEAASSSGSSRIARSSFTPAPAASAPAANAPAASAPAASAPAANASAGTACVSSSRMGGCGGSRYAGITTSDGHNTRVVNDIWNPINGASQTLTVHNAGDWSVSADMPAGNTAVVSYPDTQENYTTTSNTPEPLSDFSSITSSFVENGPGSGGGDDYEAAYDIWAGGGGHNFANEIMIWVDNHGQRPSGVEVGTASIDGVTYNLWHSGKRRARGHNTVSLVLPDNEASGSVNILGTLNWLMSNGYVPSGSGLSQIDFGWEICSTGGVSKTFSLASYSITSSLQTRSGPGLTRQDEGRVVRPGALLPYGRRWGRR